MYATGEKSVNYIPINGKAKDHHLNEDKVSSVNSARCNFLFYKITKAASSCLSQTDG